MLLPSEVKRAVRKCARNRCEYCQSQEPFSPTTFSIEHIIPRCEGSGDETENLALSCQVCNNRKFTATNARDPLTGDIVSLFNPRQNHWNDHFAWNEDFTILLGMTPSGRATIEKLHLNRISLINLRHVLYRTGIHPMKEDLYTRDTLTFTSRSEDEDR